MVFFPSKFHPSFQPTITNLINIQGSGRDLYTTLIYTTPLYTTPNLQFFFANLRCAAAVAKVAVVGWLDDADGARGGGWLVVAAAVTVAAEATMTFMGAAVAMAVMAVAAVATVAMATVAAVTAVAVMVFS